MKFIQFIEAKWNKNGSICKTEEHVLWSSNIKWHERKVAISQNWKLLHIFLSCAGGMIEGERKYISEWQKNKPKVYLAQFLKLLVIVQDKNPYHPEPFKPDFSVKNHQNTRNLTVSWAQFPSKRHRATFDERLRYERLQLACTAERSSKQGKQQRRQPSHARPKQAVAWILKLSSGCLIGFILSILSL